MKEKEIEKIKYWIEIAEYDLLTAKAMLETKRFLYVGFMCHQTIEKILKALYALKFPSETPPYSHDLLKLAKLTAIYEQMNEEQKSVIRTLEPLNIESRYPRAKDAVFSALSNERCDFIIN